MSNVTFAGATAAASAGPKRELEVGIHYLRASKHFFFNHIGMVHFSGLRQARNILLTALAKSEVQNHFHRPRFRFFLVYP